MKLVRYGSAAKAEVAALKQVQQALQNQAGPSHLTTLLDTVSGRIQGTNYLSLISRQGNA